MVGMARKAMSYMCTSTDFKGGHCIGDCTPIHDRGQSEVKRSRRNLEGGQVVKLGIRGS